MCHLSFHLSFFIYFRVGHEFGSLINMLINSNEIGFWKGGTSIFVFIFLKKGLGICFFYFNGMFPFFIMVHTYMQLTKTHPSFRISFVVYEQYVVFSNHLLASFSHTAMASMVMCSCVHACAWWEIWGQIIVLGVTFFEWISSMCFWYFHGLISLCFVW